MMIFSLIIIIIIIIISILVDLSKVLAINNELTHLENDLLYKHIQTLNDLELFYTKIIQSNNINNLKFLSNNDQNLTQVNNKITSFFLFFIDIKLKNFLVF